MSAPNAGDCTLQKKVVAIADKAFTGSITMMTIGVVLGGVLLCVAASSVFDDKVESYVPINGTQWPENTTKFSTQFMGFYFLSLAPVSFFSAILAKQLKLATLQRDCTKLEIVSYLELGLGLALQMGIIYAVWNYWILLSLAAKIYCGIAVGLGAVVNTGRFQQLQNCITECREHSAEFVFV